MGPHIAHVSVSRWMLIDFVDEIFFTSHSLFISNVITKTPELCFFSPTLLLFIHGYDSSLFKEPRLLLALCFCFCFWCSSSSSSSQSPSNLLRLRKYTTPIQSSLSFLLIPVGISILEIDIISSRNLSLGLSCFALTSISVHGECKRCFNYEKLSVG